jgi:hypothetical protein
MNYGPLIGDKFKGVKYRALMGRHRMFNDKEKWCPGCKAWLPLDNFGNCKSQPSGKRSRCKLCFKEQNTPHVRKYQNGMSDAEIVVLWEKLHRACAVCHDPIPSMDRSSSHIDRDPATREVRGLLCTRCDWGLASFRDNQIILQAAVDYLRRFELKRRERREK